MSRLQRPLLVTVFFTIVALSLSSCGSTSGHVGVSTHYGHDPFYHPHWHGHDGGDIIVVPPPVVRPPKPPRPTPPRPVRPIPRR